MNRCICAIFLEKLWNSRMNSLMIMQVIGSIGEKMQCMGNLT